MNITLKEYIADVKSQIDCNASDEYKKECVVYTYTNEQVDSHPHYFSQCLRNGLSAYKALLFFSDVCHAD